LPENGGLPEIDFGGLAPWAATASCLREISQTLSSPMIHEDLGQAQLQDGIEQQLIKFNTLSGYSRATSTSTARMWMFDQPAQPGPGAVPMTPAPRRNSEGRPFKCSRSQLFGGTDHVQLQHQHDLRLQDYSALYSKTTGS